jgi:hypothetical protein
MSNILPSSSSHLGTSAITPLGITKSADSSDKALAATTTNNTPQSTSKERDRLGNFHAAPPIEVVPSTTVLATDRIITLAPQLITEFKESGLEAPSPQNLQTLKALPPASREPFLKGLLLPEGAKVEEHPVIDTLTNFMTAFFETHVFNQMETISLPKYQKETRANFNSRANNDKAIYESLGTLSDEHLSSLSQVIQKTGEVEVPRPVADLLRELEPKLSSIRPNRLQHILDTSILIREAQKLDLIDDKNLPKLIPDFPIGLFDAKRVAEKIGLLLKLNDRIDQMKKLGILDDQQVETLKKNMGTQASETMYLYRQKSSLNKLVYLAAEAKQLGESFGPEKVTQYITTKDMLNQDVKDQQIGTLDNTRINKFLRSFSGDRQGVPFRIGRLGEKILDKMLKQEAYSDLVSKGMELRGLPPLKTPPGKAQ